MIQLEALQNNDLYDHNGGIRVAFEYASPDNRGFIGRVERFIELVKNPLYRPLIGFQQATIGGVLILGDHAQIQVEVLDVQGKRVRYVWSLSRQEQAPYEDCWMTDGVMLG